MLELYTKYTYIGWFAGGLLLGLAFIHPLTWWLFVPALWVFIDCFSKTKSTREVLLGSWLFASLKSAGAIFWFWSVYPLDWLGLSAGAGQVFLIGVYWLTCSAALGLGFALVFYLYKKLLEKHKGFWSVLPLVWVLSEIIGSLTFSIYSLGPGSLPNFDFSFGYLGYLLADVSFILPFAKLFGVYSLSFLAATFMIAVFSWKQAVLNRRTSFITLSLLAGLLLTLNLWPAGAPVRNQTVISIDTEFTGTSLVDNKGMLEKEVVVVQQVHRALQEPVDIILLPEDSRFTLAFPSPEYALRFVTENNAYSDVVLVDSSRVVDERGELVVRAFIYDTKTQSVSVIDKQYLVPQGEFVPYLHGWLIKIFASDSLSERIFSGQAFEMGVVDSYESVPEHVPPVLFCMESVSPTGVRHALEARPSSLVLHQISHAWFNESEILWFNLERMLKVQAVWNNVTIVEASNMKQSARYRPDGSVVR